MCARIYIYIYMHASNVISICMPLHLAIHDWVMPATRELFEAAERDAKGRRRPSRTKPKKGEPMENALEADELPPEDDYPAKSDVHRLT